MALLLPSLLLGQEQEIDSLINEAFRNLNEGKFFESEKPLLRLVQLKDSAGESKLIFIYNSLGLVYNNLGKYDLALDYFDKAQSLISDTEPSKKAAVYTNKGTILTLLKQYDASINYLEKAIRIYDGMNSLSKSEIQTLSAACLNYGIALFEAGKDIEALGYFERSEALKKNYKLSNLELVLTNKAKVYDALGEFDKAEYNFRKSIEKAISSNGEDYYRLPETYFAYALSLAKRGNEPEALQTLRNALYISRKNYGPKHTIVSMAEKLIGDQFLEMSELDSALYHYQKSLIAIVPGFESLDYMDNPEIDTALYDNRLLENLKKKSFALEKISDINPDKKLKTEHLRKSIETNGLAISLIDRIRREFPTEKDRLLLIQNEKTTYSDAIRKITKLYNLTSEEKLIPSIYNIARKAKAAALLDAIAGNDIVQSLSVPDSLIKRLNSVTTSIEVYEEEIRNETRMVNKDEQKLNSLKDELFSLNRELEMTRNKINNLYPDYKNLLLKASPKPLELIQKQLHPGETIIDYYIDNQEINGKKSLFSFIVTATDIGMLRTDIDTVFYSWIGILRGINNQKILEKEYNIRMKESLWNLYSILIKPIENKFAGENLIIIPDEEISWIPFDALIFNQPDISNGSFDGVDFLLSRFTVSYGYSSSLIKNPESGKSKGSINAFAPDYSISGSDYEALSGARNEIANIMKYFKGTLFENGNATKENFRNSLEKPVILHLAMHSVMDSSDSKYSFLLFDKQKDTITDNRLFNYEIGLLRINSPMVVLSTCNSGNGTLFHGEGVISLARGFIIAGAPSVVKTSWEVNDAVSSEIIVRFYGQLAKGLPKDKALRIAKMEFLGSCPPVMHNPYYWAAYELMGDNMPIMTYRNLVILLTSVSLISVLIATIFYFRRRSNLREGF